MRLLDLPLLTAVLFIGALGAFAQERPYHCGTDEMRQQIFLQHPELIPGIARASERLEEFTHEFEKQPQQKSGATYIIPVVFHVVHNYGPENISDAQIHDALKQVNIQFRKLNSDTTDIVSVFKPIAADCQIEFRLAQLDPNGNCTTGITRTVSPLTAIGDHQVKSLIHWPPDKYLNVYVCNQAAGLAGHSMLPGDADTIPEWDGIVMQHSYLGTIGTSEYFRRTVLTHEIGHYLNLQHIWGGNNVPNYFYLPCGDAGNCAFDDGVADTPNTIGWQTCSLGGYTCSSLDNVQNYMDYAYCALMFTEGQKTRMHACLNSSVANRNNLWTPANLAATGTDDLTYYFCEAKFDADKRVICAGQSVTLTDLSVHGTLNRTWTITGATLSSSTDSVITATFANPGTYTVQLQVTNGVQNLTSVQTDYITVLPSAGSISVMHEPFESLPDVADGWVVLPKDCPVNWEVTSLDGYNSLQSFTVQNFPVSAVTNFEFISQPFDASGLSTFGISFDYAYAQKQTTNMESFQISISNDCGATWSIRKNLNGSSTLKTVDTLVTTSFVPVDETQWKSDIITTVPSTYLVNDLLVKFNFIAKGGNNLYIDNIRMGDPAVMGLAEHQESEIMVFPNPAFSELNLQSEKGTAIDEVRIYDLSGKLVMTELFGESKAALNIASLSPGAYIVQVNSGADIFRKQIIKQ
jgi:PKD repeat protein